MFIALKISPYIMRLKSLKNKQVFHSIYFFVKRLAKRFFKIVVFDRVVSLNIKVTLRKFDNLIKKVHPQQFHEILFYCTTKTPLSNEMANIMDYCYNK